MVLVLCLVVSGGGSGVSHYAACCGEMSYSTLRCEGRIGIVLTVCVNGSKGFLHMTCAG